MQLDSKVALVTGGATGLGRTIATKFRDEGAIVVCASRSCSADSPGSDPNLVYDHVDVRQPDSVHALVERTVTRFGRLDILVANAGVMHNAKIQRLDPAHLDDMINTNLCGTTYCIQAAVAPMRNRGQGRIITMSSAITTSAAIGTGGYAATKAAIEMLTRVAAAEHGPHGILVNCIAPGFLEGGMTEPLLANPTQWNTYLPRLALARAGRFAEVAQTALFLAADGSTYINGAIIPVSGGWTWP